MQAFSKSHQDIILIASAVLLLVLIVGFFIWGLSAMIGGLNRSLTATSDSSEQSKADLAGARKILEGRGLLPENTSQK